MRITYRAINRHMQRLLADRYENLTNLQEKLATGKRLLRPSDDPIDVSNDLRLRTKIKQLNQFKRNINDGLSYMQFTETSISSMTDLTHRLRELAIQGSSDTLSAEDRIHIAKEVEQLLRQVVSLVNTQFKGDFIFAGTQTKIIPFPIKGSEADSIEDYNNSRMAYYDATAAAPGVPVQIRDTFTDEQITNIIPGTFKLVVSGTTYQEGTDFTIDYTKGQITINPVAWGALGVDVSAPANYQLSGVQMTFEYISRGKDIYGNIVDNSGKVLRKIENGIVTQINITSDELLVDNDSGKNFLETVVLFGQDLIQNNRAGVETAIGNIDIGLRTMLAAQVKNGARTNRYESTLDRNEMQNIETTRLHSELEDADFTKVAIDFSVAELIYNAALRSAAKIIQPSLVNFL